MPSSRSSSAGSDLTWWTAQPSSKLRLVTRFGRQVIHDGLDLDVTAAKCSASSGAAVRQDHLAAHAHHVEPGCARYGPPTGQDVTRLDEAAAVRERIGVTFQQGALFSALTVAENVARRCSNTPRAAVWSASGRAQDQPGRSAARGRGALSPRASGGMLKRARSPGARARSRTPVPRCRPRGSTRSARAADG